MSNFEAKVYKLIIEPHPNADKLELCAIGDYRAVVGKGLYKSGDYGIYIQEGSVVPKWLCEKYEWKLAGPDSNRVKAIRLRSVLSQGIVVPVLKVTTENEIDFFNGQTLPNVGSFFVELEHGTVLWVEEGQDIAAALGITKYEPPIPVHMAGEVFNAHGYTLCYDIENIKKFPDVLKNDEMVLITEKLHGTWTCFGYHPDISHPIVTSKGLSGQGLAFKMNEANVDNLYIRSLVNSADAEGNDVLDRLGLDMVNGLPLYILGETYGKGVQDLTYGLTKPHFRAFDIYVGAPGEGRYLNGHEFMAVCRKAKIETVPVLFHGPFSKQAVAELTNGKDSISGSNIREGVVIRPLLDDRRDDTLGRVILKSISAAYLLRKGDATEYT